MSLLSLFLITVVCLSSITPVLAGDDVSLLTGKDLYSSIETLTPSAIVSAAINLLLGAAGVASFIFLLWGGIHWASSGGDKDAAEKSRKKIIFALTGLAVVFSSYVMIFVVRTLFDIDPIGIRIQHLTGTGSLPTSAPAPTSPPAAPTATPTLAPLPTPTGVPDSQCVPCGSVGGCGYTDCVYDKGLGVPYYCTTTGYLPAPIGTAITCTWCADQTVCLSYP